MNIRKGKFVVVHTLKAYRGSGDITPYIFNLGVGWQRVVNFTPRPLHISVPTNRGLGGPHSSYGCYWGREKQLAPVGLEIPIIQP